MSFTQDGTTNVDPHIKADEFRDVFLSNRRSAQEAAVLAATQRPVTPQALGEPSGMPAWKSVPSWYLVAGDDHLIPPAVERFMAQRAHSHTSEVDAAAGRTAHQPRHGHPRDRGRGAHTAH